jgi:hypothetical protein
MRRHDALDQEGRAGRQDEELSFETAFASLTGLFVMAGLVPAICGFGAVAF